jgi:hypothetical protein
LIRPRLAGFQVTGDRGKAGVKVAAARSGMLDKHTQLWFAREQDCMIPGMRLSVLIVSLGIPSGASGEYKLAPTNQRVVSSETGMPDGAVESSEEEHESNGPEGDRGVEMKRLSLAQMGIPIGVLLVSGGLVFVADKRRRREAGTALDG